MKQQIDFSIRGGLLCVALVMLSVVYLWSSSSTFILPGAVWKAVVTDSSLFFLLLNDTAITEYSLDGQTKQRLSLQSNNVKLMGGALDFVLDNQSSIHGLAYTLPDKELKIIRLNRSNGECNLINLSKRFSAYRLDMDAHGNYYLLGFDAELRNAIVRGNAPQGNIYLVHKFSPSGQYLTSLLPVPSPVVKEDLQRLTNSVADRAHFVVLPRGQVSFFQSNTDGKTPPWEARGFVYSIDDTGTLTQMEPQRPEGYFLAGIHRYNGDVVFEWSKEDAFAGKRLSYANGGLVKTIPEGGRILAISNQVAATAVRKGSDSFLSVVSLQ